MMRFEDLFIAGWGQSILYRNNGDGTFTDVTKPAGLAQDKRWGSGCTFLDYNRDAHLDLFVANYLDFDLAKAPTPGQTAMPLDGYSFSLRPAWVSTRPSQPVSNQW